LADSDLVNMLCREAIQAAADGTLFIPDLQRSSRQAQHALLEQLPECRGQVVSAATPDLFLAVEQGRFSNRLFYRLNILHFRIDEADSAPECLPREPSRKSGEAAS
jgi:transcriptional regulator of acetoin/glycerol metabolism